MHQQTAKPLSFPPLQGGETAQAVLTMPPMARLKKGEAPEPPRDNRQKLINQLIKDGGRRMVLELDGPVNEHLQNLYLHLAAAEKGRGVNYKEAICRAIVAQSLALGPAPASEDATTQQQA